jgi:hypothetical protein
MLSLFNLPCAGFCEMSELLTVPCILIGNRQLPPDTTSISLFELWPQSASVADIEQSEAARANDADIKLVAPTISAKAATLDNCIVASSFSCKTHTGQGSFGEGHIMAPELDERVAHGAVERMPN